MLFQCYEAEWSTDDFMILSLILLVLLLTGLLGMQLLSILVGPRTIVSKVVSRDMIGVQSTEAKLQDRHISDILMLVRPRF